MEYYGSYHGEGYMQAAGLCDAPRTSKGSMSVAGFDTASEGGMIALVWGRMRNRAALARQLECPPYAAQALLALRAYQKWGRNYLEHIHGPCISCIADVDADRMIIARDRMGECSLFYAWRDGRLMFADHPDAMLRSGFIEAVLDRQGAQELFGLGPARTPGCTPLRGLKSLEPGCMLLCEAGRLEKMRWFCLATQPEEAPEREIVAQVRQLLEAAVGDVVHLHPACMLSGGVDSTALAALLSMRIGRLDSFSVDYEGNEQDFVANSFRPEMDAPYIRLAARTFGSRHRQALLAQDALAAYLVQAMRSRGFPGMGDIDSSLLLFAREIVRHSPAVVSGECGDEVFGGYPWFRGEGSLSEDSFPWSGSLALRESMLRPELRGRLNLRGYVRDRLHQALDGFDLSCISDPQERRLFQLQRLCFDFFMPNLQERASQICLRQGLTLLTPLCDDRLVQYVYNVPWRIKRLGGVDKGLYREAVAELLPDKLRLRKKSPYPKTCSPAYADALRSMLRELFADPHAPLWRLADQQAVERLAASPLDPADTPWFGQLMAGPQLLAYLIQINAWLKERSVAIEL